MATEQEYLVSPDFSEVKDRISEGVYKMRIVGSEVGVWPGKDGKKATAYIGWTLETFGEDESKNNGRKFTHNTAIEGQGAFRLQDFYRAAMGEDLKGKFDRTMLHGREIEATIGPQKNRPEYNEVKACKPLSH